jgi:colanic acid biosynthesis glycosyl transferase WcaI
VSGQGNGCSGKMRRPRDTASGDDPITPFRSGCRNDHESGSPQAAKAAGARSDAAALTGCRILLVEQFFYPEGWGGAEIPRDIAAHFARSGARVEVLCGAEPYVPVRGDPGPDPRSTGVTVQRVPRFPASFAARGRIHSLKLLRHAWFALWAFVLLLLRRPPDLFVAQTNPPPGILLAALAAALWRRPFLLIAMDIYPEVLIAHRRVADRRLPLRVAQWAFDRAYRSATRVVALGPGMAERIAAKGVPGERIVRIGNWATGPQQIVREEASSIRRRFGLGSGPVLLYAGNLGLGHEFDTLLRGFALARVRVPELQLLFVGQGPRLAETQARARDLGLRSSVTFAPPVPAAELPALMGIAALGVVTLRSGFEGLMVPSKLAGYLARGVPSLYVGPWADAAFVIAHHGCGIAVAEGDIGGVAAAITGAVSDPRRLAAMGRAAREAAARDFDRETALARYVVAARACLDTGRA